MKNLFLSVAFTLIGSFAFANAKEVKKDSEEYLALTKLGFVRERV